MIKQGKANIFSLLIDPNFVQLLHKNNIYTASEIDKGEMLVIDMIKWHIKTSINIYENLQFNSYIEKKSK